jgi:hypothetical protein
VNRSWDAKDPLKILDSGLGRWKIMWVCTIVNRGWGCKHVEFLRMEVGCCILELPPYRVVMSEQRPKSDVVTASWPTSDTSS